MSRPLMFVVDLPPYPCHVLVCFGASDKALLERLKEFEVSAKERTDETWKMPKHCDWLAHLWESGKGVLRMRSRPASAYLKGCLAHEIFNVVDKVLSHVDIPLVHETEEAYAYLTGFLTEEIYKRL